MSFSSVEGTVTDPNAWIFTTHKGRTVNVTDEQNAVSHAPYLGPCFGNAFLNKDACEICKINSQFLQLDIPNKGNETARCRSFIGGAYQVPGVKKESFDERFYVLPTQRFNVDNIRVFECSSKDIPLQTGV